MDEAKPWIQSACDVFDTTPAQLEEFRNRYETNRRNNLRKIVSMGQMYRPKTFSTRHLNSHSTHRNKIRDSRIMEHWQTLEYAYRDVTSQELHNQLMAFMQRLADAIGARDPLFECRVVPVGSAYEGTKVGRPDEFDVNFELTQFSSLYEVVTSPACPPGFVHLRRHTKCK